MRIIACYAVAVAAAAAALAVAATPAVAATGQLSLRGSGGSLLVLNPNSGSCVTTAFAISQVANNTDAAVAVHTDAGCSGPALVVEPGRTASVGARHSVRVLS
jgi:hypothetical protein